MTVVLEVDRARSYALDFAEERFECPTRCLRLRGQRRTLAPPQPFQAVSLQFEDRRCAQRFDEILKAYDPDRQARIVKR